MMAAEETEINGLGRRNLRNQAANELQSTALKTERAGGTQAFYSIPELAERWRCSRASVYNRIRGERILDFAAKGRKGHKVVPIEVVSSIEQRHMKILR